MEFKYSQLLFLICIRSSHVSKNVLRKEVNMRNLKCPSSGEREFAWVESSDGALVGSQEKNQPGVTKYFIFRKPKWASVTLLLSYSIGFDFIWHFMKCVLKDRVQVTGISKERVHEMNIVKVKARLPRYKCVLRYGDDLHTFRCPPATLLSGRAVSGLFYELHRENTWLCCGYIKAALGFKDGRRCSKSCPPVVKRVSYTLIL